MTGEITCIDVPVPTDVPDVLLVAPRLALAFRYALSKQTAFQEDFEVLANVVGAARFLINSTSKLSVRIVDPVALSVSFVWKHDTALAKGKLPYDLALQAGIEAVF